jgi:hypothetical protein
MKGAPMTRFHLNAFLLLTLVLLAAPRTGQAAESYDSCNGFITSLPAVIATQGTWCLKQDLSTAMTSGDAITINTSNVTIDCNNFKLGGLAAGLGTLTRGIYAFNRLNATVRHCNIRGFHNGVRFEGSSGGGHAVEDNRFDGNTAVGIDVEGDGSVVQRNRVFDTGSTTQNPYAIGILTSYSVDVLDNTVSGVVARSGGGGNAYGIYTNGNPDGRIVGNGIRGVTKDGAGAVMGIYNESTGRLIITGNHLVGDGSPNSLGIFCVGANGSAKENVISGFAGALDTCVDSGGNSVIP